MIHTWFGSQSISCAEVLAWETKRVTKGLRAFGVPVPSGELPELRAALLDAKLAIGREAVERRLAREISISDKLTGLVARASKGRRRVSQVELLVPGARADQLPAWYAAKNAADDERAFLAATPDHHLFRPVPNTTVQEVWETTGGSPVASRLFIDLESTEGLVTPPDPSYPVQLAGAAHLADGTLLGGIRHQLRDEADGTRVLLTVEFPWLMGPQGPAAHRWHLASEFASWMQAAAG